ncbi:AAA domain (dynein-related subfamily) [Popillia japonica]|uniref:AAA domain (Dynein-related subfamily) n=1 Tax=Popillia japonica TaxID=7064 RepID=A0AAW1LWU6_POPJA
MWNLATLSTSPFTTERYDLMKQQFNITDDQLSINGVLKIHPDFRIIAIGEPPALQTGVNWMSPEVLSLFIFHEAHALSKHEEMHIITSQCGVIQKPLHQIIDLAHILPHILRRNPDPALRNLSGHLSTRQLLRIASRMAKFPTDDAYDTIEATFMMKFLPSLTREALERTVQNLGINSNDRSQLEEPLKYGVVDGVLTIGGTTARVYRADNTTKVPNILFYDVPQHLHLMERLLQDFQLGQHLFLVGNQGVGKNKIADRFLELLNRPREYIQLHRDTTVQTLTVQPTIKDGILIHEDSPLVRAIKNGHVLVVDEADKAPTHVTCILKTLVESGQMILSDGRRIVTSLPQNVPDPANYILTHPEFRIIVLANRPGFPFLGNDFFGALGDLFSSHAVDNPTRKSEINMLKQYGPDVPEGMIRNKDVSSPKHGKIDPKNDPHVGGNTWAGGTGGRDTAGLGGKGGPYRLDAGHPVHQLSDAEKAAVPEHVLKAAREMGKKAFQEKLKEIGMSGYDATLYTAFSRAVSKQVQSLRVILGSLQAKNKERQWSRHQTTGELDDIKLIDGILGEKNIFRRRKEQEPELGTPQMKPKFFRVVVDVSGSMYRFNSYDGRLDRELEAVVLVMEAFEGFEDKIVYDIIGHSGDTDKIEFVRRKEPPKNNKERLDILRVMHAHSQYCWQGDHTLEATKLAVEELAQEDCDEAIVVVLSDANLQRYGISPTKLGSLLTSHEKVKAYTIFIGGLGDQAERLTQQLPAGHAFICIDLQTLPQILKQIFSSSVITS